MLDEPRHGNLYFPNMESMQLNYKTTVEKQATLSLPFSSEICIWIMCLCVLFYHSLNIQKTVNCGPRYLFFTMSTNDPRLGTKYLSNWRFHCAQVQPTRNNLFALRRRGTNFESQINLLSKCKIMKLFPKGIHQDFSHILRHSDINIRLFQRISVKLLKKIIFLKNRHLEVCKQNI